MRVIILVAAFFAVWLYVPIAYADEFTSESSDVEPTTPVTGYAFKSSASPSATILPTTAENKAPVADAGKSITVAPHALVVLNGGNSKDSDGTIVSYAWRQLAGPKVELLSARTPYASFTAGKDAISYIFQLTVRDNGGASAVDLVTISVRVPPLPSASPVPVATVLPTASPTPSVSAATPFSFTNTMLVLLGGVLLVLIVVFGRVAFTPEA